MPDQTGEPYHDDLSEAERTARLRARLKRIAVVVAVALGVVTALLVADRVTAGPEVCSACHEIRPAVATWERSVHFSVGCADCHVGPYGPAQLPRSVVEQTALLVRDSVSHVRGDYPDPVTIDSADGESIPDTVCFECHRADRQITPKPGILIDHREHARRNDSCVSCHIRTAHPLPTRGSSLTLMTQCYTCHGTPEQPTASGECTACHPEDFDPRPVSHETGKWSQQHGQVSLADTEQCDMCHEQAYCDDCHGLPMPHPENWLDPEQGHAVFSAESTQACAQCHKGGANLCTSCHHPAFDSAKGSWLKQHPEAPAPGGSAMCVDCHSPLFCSRCHAERRPR